MDRKVLGEVAEALANASSIVITTHIQPDGDALGSILAISRHLRQAGKKVCVTWGEEIRVPAHYQWMPGIDEIVEYGACIEADLLLALDCANEQRLGFMAEKLPLFKTVVNIDHHIDNSAFGTLNVLDFEASASCEIVYDLLMLMGSVIDEVSATLLYTGIVTDTGRFQYSNTTAKTHDTASHLIRLGVKPNEVFQSVYESMSFASLKWLGAILERAVFIDASSLVFSYVCAEDLKATGASLGDTESFIDYLRVAREAEVAAILKETPEGKLKVSLRSKGVVDVGSIAREGGGGGHRNAAGLTTDKSLDEAVAWISARISAQTPS
ncbi:MAG: bifunctional oligoribonuclease/PAP phosphatase NrnA [Actinomycetota bacterium]|nr:bifunctional oligoribonuclease/PAP phosphatase NrnA [Actinomycetota bacterium]